MKKVNRFFWFFWIRATPIIGILVAAFYVGLVFHFQNEIGPIGKIAPTLAYSACLVLLARYFKSCIEAEEEPQPTSYQEGA